MKRQRAKRLTPLPDQMTGEQNVNEEDEEDENVNEGDDSDEVSFKIKPSASHFAEDFVDSPDEAESEPLDDVSDIVTAEDKARSVKRKLFCPEIEAPHLKSLVIKLCRVDGLLLASGGR